MSLTGVGTCVLSSYVDIYLKMSRCSASFIQHIQPNLSKKQNSRVQFPPAIRQVSLEQWRRLREERLELSQRAICALRAACVNKARPATASRRTQRELINKETCRTRIQSIQHHETRSLSRSGGCVITVCPDQSYSQYHFCWAQRCVERTTESREKCVLPLRVMKTFRPQALR